MENGYELRKTATKGEGIFATIPFKAGGTVLVGMIEKVLDKNDSHATQIGEDSYVRYAGLIIKTNHSCSPNCGVKENKAGVHELVAMKDISIDEEITFDYAMRNYTIAFFPDDNCTCGSKQCRGKISGWKDLPEEKKQEYQGKGFVVPYLLELDNKLGY